MIIGFILTGVVIATGCVIYNEIEKVKRLKKEKEELTQFKTDGYIQQNTQQPTSRYFPQDGYVPVNYNERVFVHDNNSSLDSATGAFIGSMTGTMLANSIENKSRPEQSVQETNISNFSSNDGGSDITYDGNSSQSSWNDSSSDSSSWSDSGSSSSWD